MICKLIEAVNHLSILIAVMKYMDDLLEETHIEGKERISQIKLTPRLQEHCAVPEEFNPLTEGKLSVEQREKREEGKPTHDRQPPRDIPCSVKWKCSSEAAKRWCKRSSVSQTLRRIGGRECGKNVVLVS